MTRMFTIAALLLGLLLPVGPVAAQVDRSIAEQLMRKSGLWEQLGSVAPQIRAGLGDAAARGAKPLPADERDRLVRSFDAAFSPARLRQTAMAIVSAEMSPADVPKLLAWYDGAAGKTATALEEAASANEGDPTALMQAGNAQLAQATPRRRALLKQLVKVTKVAEVMSSMTIDTALAIAQGVAQTQGGQGAPAVAEMRGVLEAQRAKMIEGFNGLALAIFAATYQPLPDADLAAYIAFLKTPAGTRFSTLSIRAVDKAMVAAATDVGREIPNPQGNGKL